MNKIPYFLLFFTLISCQPHEDKKTPTPTPPSISSLKVGAFNIQIFGVSKMSNSSVADILVKTVSRYDLVLIQEIRDAGGTSIVNFMNQLNAANTNRYQYLISPRLGRSTSKEQYAYIYNKNLLSITSSFTYNDSVEDIFEREPLVARFKHIPSSEEFITIGIHVKPDDVINELNHLDDVYDFAENYWKVDNAIIMGDLNADCSYLSNTQENNLDLKNSRFTWHLDTSMDTTLATSACAYDRIITTGTISNKVNEVEIFNFKTFFNLDSELAEDVSDHYPVGIKLLF